MPKTASKLKAFILFFYVPTTRETSSVIVTQGYALSASDFSVLVKGLIRQ